VATAIGVGVSAIQWCILILTIGAVLILEGLNTAIEALVDLASPSCHPLAKVAKDVAAAMVLMAAIGSVPIGLLILGPPLWRLLAGSVGL
jgi:diacylglycerol kinase